jgi:archaellum biogenesis ATPase FlaH
MDIAKEILTRELTSDENALFIIKPANEWIEEASKKPIPKMLFGELWHEGELCILFADTNVGKSILAVQIANGISKGERNDIFNVTAPAQRVLYFDFELSDKQFETRYSMNYFNPYHFDPNFLRVEMNPEYELIGNFEDVLQAEIEKEIQRSGVKILIVDNITYLKTQSTDTAREALPLMTMLNKLKKKYGLSILALAHTPKRDHYKPITVNDLAGSKHLSNFADSIIAIGQSNKGKSTKFIKQIKARITEKRFDSEWVIVCEVEKRINFLCFNHIEFGNEIDHLKQRSEADKGAVELQVIEFFTNNPNLSYNKIGEQLSVHPKTVARIVNRHKETQ